MRCLHCGKRLSLLRKLSDAEFCSAEHRQEFQQQQSDLALARLIESQNRIDRPRVPLPAMPFQSQRKAEEEPVFPMAEPAREKISAVATLRLHAPETELVTRATEAGLPLTETSLVPKGFPAPGPIPLALPLALNFLGSGQASGRAVFELTEQVPWHTARVHNIELRTHPELRRTSSLFALGLALRALPTDPILKAAAPVQIPTKATGMPASGLELARIEFLPVAGGTVVGGFEGVDDDDLSWPFSDTQQQLLQRAHEADLPFRVIEPQPILSTHAEGSGRDPQLASLVVPGGASRRNSGPRVRRADAMEPLRVHAVHGTTPTSSPVQLPLPAILEELRPALRLQFAQASLPGTRNPALQPVATAPAIAATRLADCGPVTILPRLATGLPTAPAFGQPSLRPVRRAARIPVKAMTTAAGAGTPSVAPELPAMEQFLPYFGAPAPAVNLQRPGQHQLSLGAHSLLELWTSFQPAVALAISASAGPTCPGCALSLVPPVAQDPEAVAEPVAAGEAATLAPSSSQPEPAEALPPLQDLIPVMLPRPASVARPKQPLWAQPVMELRQMSDGFTHRTPFCKLTIDHADGSGARSSSRTGKSKNASSLFRFAPPRIPGRRFWLHAPADLKWVVLGLPLLLILVVYSFRSSPAAPAAPAAPAVADATKGKTVLGSQMNSLQKVLLHRAAIKLFDDFRGGLGAWQGSGGWSETWKYGEASFLEPGQLALYTPTVDMRDYSFQFLGQVERKSLNWVFRASDTKNYYSMRIVFTKGGPLPSAQLIRSIFRNGKEGNVKVLPIPFSIRPDTLYLVKMDVRGSDFTTYIQGQVVDTFTDSSLQSGGVGFYCPKGEKSFLRWVEVTHQYDFIGRLCAMLAPYDITTQGTRSN